MHSSLRLWRFLPEFLILAAILFVQYRLCRWLWNFAARFRPPGLRLATRLLALFIACWVVFSVASTFTIFLSGLPSSWTVSWVRGTAIAWCMASVVSFVFLKLWRRVPVFNPQRRGFIHLAGTALATAPFAGMAFGILIERTSLRTREIDVPIRNLPKDLDHLRIVQLSDIHLSPFLSERDLARAVDMANEMRGNLALVTGDLITACGDPLDACLHQLARLRADVGILGCLGNHEIYAQVEDEATEKGARLGINFLRQKSRLLRFGNASLNITGVDYQRLGRPYLVGTERSIVPGVTNILLSHNPDVFDVSARQGWDLTISGHTHGGQVTVEILKQQLNLTRFITPYIYGLYRRGPSSIWVTRGIGTVGVPARLGAPPEVVLIRLCAT
jgi:predicted MPP superfamily phosphohydrolase